MLYLVVIVIVKCDHFPHIQLNDGQASHVQGHDGHVSDVHRNDGRASIMFRNIISSLDQVQGEGLPHAQLDRVACPSARGQAGPDPQPQPGHHLPVSGPEKAHATISSKGL